ncbi:MAG: polysaccharide deacetylase family protein [Caldilineaceae bacterium]|nr:polysaccharide deacetylase family protein [Caldilineaceae bacterium]HRJ42955.1 polysaccharide deacetylase family protein [Caldilineaceae bacterium]
MRTYTLILAILLVLANALPAGAQEKSCPNCAPLPAGSLRLPYRWTNEGAITLLQNRRGSGWSARLESGVDVRVSPLNAVGDLNGDGIDDRALLLESRANRRGPYASGTRWEMLVLLGSEQGIETVAAGVTFSLSLAVTQLAISGGKVAVGLAEGETAMETAFALESDGLHRADGELTILTHLVRREETLSKIASRYRVTVADLMARNGISNGNQLAIGQALSIPSSRPQNEPVGDVPFLFFGLAGEELRPGDTLLPLRPAQHVVQAGERWEQIAAQHRVSLPDLIDVNGLRLSSPPDPGQVIFIPGIPREKVIYLTFDDGPHKEWTPKFLDLLARFQAQATFFVNGVYANLYPELIQREIDEGHGIANHSYYHSHFDKLTLDRVAWELISTQTAIGVENQAPCFRPPYGILPPDAWNVVAGQGYEVVIWDIDSLDWKKTDAVPIAAPVLERAYDGAIVLMHDGGDERPATLAALEMVLTELGAQGYRFEAYCKK